MASTYGNDLRLEEIGDGEQSGTWGATTNTNLELISEALSFGTEGITTNADTHTTTIADGASDPGRSLYLKYTGTLDSTCTITIAPNSISKTWYIENGTSGSQSIIISQGSGANVTIKTGQTKIVYSDGAGSTAAMAEIGTLGVTNLAVGGNIDVDGVTNLDAVDIDGAVQLDSTLTVGANDQGYDVTLYGDTAARNATWDSSADSLIFTDNTKAVFGTGSDASILFDGTDMKVGATAGHLDLFTSEAALNGVAKALSDGRGAVRYFRKILDLEGNPYGIDGNQIYFGGNSAGGVIAVHAAFMQEEDITDPELLAALNALGGIEGDSGNDGYSSEVRGAISLAGAAADVSFITIDENHKLLISCHGDEDPVVPYNCGQPLQNNALPQLCGGGAMFAHTQEIGFTNHNHLEFVGAGHVPWEYAGDTQTQMIEFVSENLLNALDCANVGVEELTFENSSVYPNPTQNIFKFENEKSVAIVTLYTLNGTQVLQVENTNTVDVEHLPKGIYLVEIIHLKQQKSYTRLVKI